MMLLEDYVTVIDYTAIYMSIGIFVAILIALAVVFCVRKHRRKSEDISLVKKHFTEDEE